MLGRVVCGSRTWMCTMAAPALAASIADCAICGGVTGTAGLRPGVSAEPVTAQEIITLRCMAGRRSGSRRLIVVQLVESYRGTAMQAQRHGAEAGPRIAARHFRRLAVATSLDFLRAAQNPTLCPWDVRGNELSAVLPPVVHC